MVFFKDRMGKELTLREAMPKIFSRLLNVFLEFKLMLLRLVGHLPIHFIRRWTYRLAGVKIGKGSTIHMWCNFFNPAGVKIGEDTIIGDHCFLDGRAPLEIGDHVDIASRVLIYNSHHDVHDEEFRPIEKPVTIEDYVFIGARAIILPGVKVGRGAVVAAGAVVTKEVAPKKIVGGVPAQEIGERRVAKLRYRLGRARLFQ